MYKTTMYVSIKNATLLAILFVNHFKTLEIGFLFFRFQRGHISASVTVLMDTGYSRHSL